MADRSPKISANVFARLDGMLEGETIPVIVLIGQPSDEELPRPTDTRRQQISSLDEETRETVHEIDQALTSYGGSRLKPVNLLGALPVIATAPAIRAIAIIPSVCSIIEDQALRGLFLADSRQSPRLTEKMTF